MGCGSSKRVEITVKKPAESSPVKPKDVCINQENGESFEPSDCQDSTVSGNDNANSPKAEPAESEPANESNEINDLLLDASSQNVLPSTIDQIDYEELFRIIAKHVYLADIQHVESLRNNVEDLKEKIQDAALQADRDLPPIPEDESNTENPRRKRPARNLLRERISITALEVATAYRILEYGGLYKKDFSEIYKLEKEYEYLQDYLRKITE